MRDLASFCRYAYIEIDGCDPQQTKCISGTLNPEWNETFTFKIDKPLGKELKVKVYDKDLGRDDVLGELQWDLCKLKMGHGPKDIEKTVRRGVRFPSTRRHH